MIETITRRMICFAGALVVTASAFAQNGLFVAHGFENVRLRRDSTEYVLTLENNARYPDWKAARIATELMDSICTNRNATIVFLKRDVPLIAMKRREGIWNADYENGRDFQKTRFNSNANSTVGKVDFFLGLELLYRDWTLDVMYEVLVNLNPSVRWHMGNGWEIVGQVSVPVYNTYGDYYKRIRPTMAVLSNFSRVARHDYLKVSGGLFSHERYGVDVKWWHPIDRHWMIDAQMGITGFCSMATDWEASKPKRLLGLAGVQYYWNEKNVSIRLSGGRYLYEDYGTTIDVKRHFSHCTIGVFGQYCKNWLRYGGHKSAGFYLAMDLPPYQQKRRKKVNSSLADNFRITYNMMTDAVRCKVYRTDPEESERDAAFHPAFFQWGLDK